MKKKKKDNRGGKRTGAGRPLIADPKVKIQFGVLSSHVKMIGGEKKVVALCQGAINQVAEDTVASQE